jgi:hypothetical protein
MCLFESCTCFKQLCAHPQEDNCINPINAELNSICHLPILLGDLTFMGQFIVSIFQYTSISNKMQSYTVYLYLETALHVRVVLPPIIRSPYTCIYTTWYLSHRYCYLPLSWKSWNWFECAVCGVRHPQHTQTGSSFSMIAADSSNGVTNTRCYRDSFMRS